MNWPPVMIPLNKDLFLRSFDDGSARICYINGDIPEAHIRAEGASLARKQKLIYKLNSCAYSVRLTLKGRALMKLMQ